MNKTIIKNAVTFYNTCWKERNKVFHSKEIQTKFLNKQCVKTEKYAKIIGGEAKKYKDMYKIDLEKASVQYKKDWIRNVQYFIANQDEFKKGDMQKFLLGNKK